MNASGQEKAPKEVPTSFIVQNLKLLISRYDKRNWRWADAIRDYDIFMSSIRPHWLMRIHHNYQELLRSEGFVEEVRKVLKAFGMDSRGSILTSPSLFLDTTTEASRDFDLLGRAEVQLDALNLRNKVETETVTSIIKNIYNLFSQTKKLSVSGGMVIASKAMHMIMPELFIMIDHRIMGKLHRVSDYYPHPSDGKNWYDVIPNYHGTKLNPYAGYGWDSDQCYLAALVYYKRVIL